jgi:hypothetical protein
MTSKNGNSLVLAYKDGRRIMIRKADISAIDGNCEGTTFYLRGHIIQTPNSVENILAALSSQGTALIPKGTSKPKRKTVKRN